MLSLLDEQTCDTNTKWRVQLEDGSAVEAVLYRRDSLCISSQVGCAVSCPFCASGAHGLGRQLSADELIAQITEVRSLGRTVARVTVSGVGEPLHNHANVVRCLEWCRGEGLGMSLTTSGGPLPRLREWLQLPHRGLTLSVHAGTEEVRARMVPRAPKLDPLFEVLREEMSMMSGARMRKVALAYLIIEGVNDSEEEMDAFIERVRPLGVKVHVYSHNAVPTSPLHGVSEDRYRALAGRVRAAGLDVRMSSLARTQPNGGCGTLVALRGARAAPRSTARP
ncbi:MAG: radical SAM protein [Nannocystaceae bacterium]